MDSLDILIDAKLSHSEHFQAWHKMQINPKTHRVVLSIETNVKNWLLNPTESPQD